MDAGEAGRHPCPWRTAPDAWPDRCTESADGPCASTIEKQCMRGDHRRCAVGACTVSTRWHDEVRAAGVAAARVAGQAWAVVSTIPGDVEVVGTSRGFDQAERLLRRVLRSAGRADDPESRGLLYLVRRSDGGFL